MGIVLFSETSEEKNEWECNYSKVKDEAKDFEKVIEAIDQIFKDSYKLNE